MYQVTGVAKKHLALREVLSHDAETQMCQVAKAAVNETGRSGRGAETEVLLL
jgi:hypothetical protein